MKHVFSLVTIAVGVMTAGTANAASICGTPSFSCVDQRPDSDDESCTYFVTADDQSVYRVEAKSDQVAIDNSANLGRMCFDDSDLTKLN